MKVFVIDNNRKPLDPCCHARARILLKRGRAVVFRRYPFTIILKNRTIEEPVVHEHRIKIDPGSKVTGVAIVQEETGQVVAAAEIEHRGQAVKASLLDRKVLRRNRRARKTRYRRPRSKAEAANQEQQKKAKGWLPPSLESRLANVLTWVGRFLRICPITAASQELVRFDLQKEQNPEISGIEYQQGTLAGYEVREYLLEKHHRTCASCDKTDGPLQVEHIVPRSRGGTDRVSNLTLACETCNTRKGNRPVADFLKRDPDRLAKVKRDAKRPLKDATAVNATRWELFRRLQATGLPVETGSGGRHEVEPQDARPAQDALAGCGMHRGEHPGAPRRRGDPAAPDQGMRPRQAEPLLDGHAWVPDPARSAEEDREGLPDRRHRPGGHPEGEAPGCARRPSCDPVWPELPDREGVGSSSALLADSSCRRIRIFLRRNLRCVGPVPCGFAPPPA